MSAEVVLMNKNGIAIATDSAVTIGDKTKIYNTADKMFMLSKYAPVGILIYNNSSLMGIQLELIIKQYREKIGDKKFSKLEEYVEDFIKFCILFTNRYSGKKMEVKLIKEQILNKCDNWIGIALDQAMEEANKREIKNDKELMDILEAKIQTNLSKIKIPEKTKNNDEIIDEICYNEIEKIVKVIIDSYGVRISEKTKNELIKKIDSIIRYKQYWDTTGFTGMAITGYGEDEIFPSCIQIETLGIINNKMIEIKKIRLDITHENNSQIIPLAQTDVMNEFFLGVNSELDNEYMKEFDKKIKKQSEENIKNEIIKLKTIIQNRREEIVFNRFENINKSLSFLPREEMIYMAEGMVNLTSFKRRLVLDSYSETVGGPIDIAYISKGDGFVWIKRKKYFEKEMNYVFTKNYFRKKEK